MKQRIAVDFDNTLCGFAYPDIGPIKPGAKEALEGFKKLGYEIVIWSCRTCKWDFEIFGGSPNDDVMKRPTVEAMKAWLDSHEIPYDVIDDGSKGKPHAVFYIDDRAISFKDNWREIAAFIDERGRP